MKTHLKQFITDESYKLERSIVATPETRQYLESFAKANHGSNDFLLMQMAIQFGYKVALKNLEEKLKLTKQLKNENI